MTRLLVLLTLAATALLRAAGPSGPVAESLATDPLEKELRAFVVGPQVTVVHFWAPWCGNCKAEMKPEGWAKFIAENPEVKFVFVNLWSRGQDPAPKLAAGGLGGQPNLLLLTHPNPSSKKADRVTQLMGLPITWIPTTWVFKDGEMRFALNYGEIRFEMLQQLVKDSRDTW